jgi:hypothetical protein
MLQPMQLLLKFSSNDTNLEVNTNDDGEEHS